MLKPFKHSVFSTPLLSSVLGGLASVILRVIGWRVETRSDLPKQFVAIAAPHTSNWDFALMLCVVLHLRLDLRWLGKAEIFPRPFGAFMRWLGGIPVDRSKSNNLVQQVADCFAESDGLRLLLAPEGTRGGVSRWKSGFYYIALQAQVPIVLGFLDGKNKRCGFDQVFLPTGDYATDQAYLRDYYSGFTGLRSDG